MSCALEMKFGSNNLFIIQTDWSGSYRRWRRHDELLQQKHPGANATVNIWRFGNLSKMEVMQSWLWWELATISIA
jgi:hypothetical protein